MKNINCICCDFVLNINSLYKENNQEWIDYTASVYCNNCNCEYIHSFSNYIKSFCYFKIKKKNLLKPKDVIEIRFEYLIGYLKINYSNNTNFSNEYSSYEDEFRYQLEEIPKDPFIELSIQYKYYLKYIDNIIFA
jgi:hypothetical protein